MRQGLTQLILTLLICGFAGPGLAQDKADLRVSPDAHYEYIVLPPLMGAISLEGGLTGPFALNDGAEAVNEVGFYLGGGWRHFLTPHGEWSLRGYGFYEGRRSTNRTLGAGLALMVRGFNPRFVFGGFSAFLEGGLTTGSNLDSDASGGRASFGLEATGGALIGGSYPMFAETGANLSLTFGSIEGLDYWEVIGRWIIRFDISFRTDIPEPSQSTLAPMGPSR